MGGWSRLAGDLPHCVQAKYLAFIRLSLSCLSRLMFWYPAPAKFLFSWYPSWIGFLSWPKKNGNKARSQLLRCIPNWVSSVEASLFLGITWNLLGIARKPVILYPPELRLSMPTTADKIELLPSKNRKAKKWVNQDALPDWLTYCVEVTTKPKQVRPCKG